MSTPENTTPVLTISQITNAIKHCLEGTFSSVWLEGEISNFKQQTSGHLYFTLKDSGAQISAVMFRASASSLKKYQKMATMSPLMAKLMSIPQVENIKLSSGN